MKKENNNLNEYDALMIYLNECEDKELVNRTLTSKQGCKQLESLQKDMQTIENNINEYSLNQDYGSDLWNKIADKLENVPKTTWFQRLFIQLQQPKFSAIGLVALFTVASSFYLMGRNQSVVDNDSNQLNQNLLAQNMQFHLAQTDMFLTQISNMSQQQSSPVLVNTAQSLLTSNRIFKNAYANKGNNRLINLLTELEQVLIEVSNGNRQYSQKYIQDYTNNGLLFKVKSINQQLKSQKTISTTTSI